MTTLTKRRRPRTASAALSAVVCVLFALPSSAFAGEVFNDPDSPQFLANNAGETNNVTVAASPGSVTFSDATTPVTAAGCTQVNANTVTCTPPPGSTGFSSYSVFAGDLNDSITASGPLSGDLFGGEGNDSVIGSNENSALTDPTTGFFREESRASMAAREPMLSRVAEATTAVVEATPTAEPSTTTVTRSTWDPGTTTHRSLVQMTE